ncbi:MAG: nuclear transport factor 2 family protein [Lyngbya sp.]|nr:nuclear transport factor 2 family protein [Lyngbya sp.]
MISMNLLEILKRLKAWVVTSLAVLLCSAYFSAPVLADASVPNSEPIFNSNFLAYYMADEDTTEETKQVWEHHIQAWDNSDLEDIMSDYSEDSILILNNTLYKGIDQVACVFDSLFDIFANGNNIIAPETIEGEVIYITWNYTPFNDDSYDGTDSFVVRNGVIEYQTIASRLYEQYPILCKDGIASAEPEIEFTADFLENLTGELVRGGKFKVNYDRK